MVRCGVIWHFRWVWEVQLTGRCMCVCVCESVSLSVGVGVGVGVGGCNVGGSGKFNRLGGVAAHFVHAVLRRQLQG